MTQEISKDYILEMKSISKSFPGVKALSNANLRVKPGEVHALVGENGAGKSTLMNVLLGSIEPNSGEIIYRGKKVCFHSPHEALLNGISMVHQEMSLIPSVSVAENIWVGREPEFTRFGLISEKKRLARTQALLEKYHINIDPRSIVRTLSIANMQLVEIARAISYNPKILIMDEPTSSLSDREILLLYDIIKSLAKEGTTVMFISHKLDEVFQLCDRITVMRDGSYINNFAADEITKEELIARIAGRKISEMYPKIPCEIKDTVLEVKNLSHKGLFKNISFQVRAGEILGLFGLVGAGRTETMEGIFGIRSLDEGEIYLNGSRVTIRSPKEAIYHGLAMVTEDRRKNGIISNISVKYNISLANLKRISRGNIWIRKRKEDEDTKALADKLAVKTPSLNQPIGALSGGNQQKAIIARWLYTNPKVLILDEPTRGIDVGSKSEIHRMISTLAGQGLAVVMISSECEEVMGISDHVIVFHNGHISGEFNRSEFDQERLIQSAFNVNFKEVHEGINEENE